MLILRFPHIFRVWGCWGRSNSIHFVIFRGFRCLELASAALLAEACPSVDLGENEWPYHEKWFWVKKTKIPLAIFSYMFSVSVKSVLQCISMHEKFVTLSGPFRYGPPFGSSCRSNHLREAL